MTGIDGHRTSTEQVEVAVLFTDIEGSTPKWESDAAAMRDQLTRHDEVLTRSIAECAGTVVKHTGDGFLARFDDVRDAVSAAVTAQLALAALDFSTVDGLRIRTAIDVGPVEERDGDLYGTPLNRSARIMDAAHGGQVLVSEHVWEGFNADPRLHIGGESTSIGFLDLGLHRLKGLARPLRLFQVAHPSLIQTFPPLRSLNSSLGNLPIDNDIILGRDDLVKRIAELLESPGIVTLVGPGGVGKTSLAIRLGHEVTAVFPDGIWFVDFAEVSNPRGVASAIARVMGLSRRSGQSLESTLRDVLSSRQALLVLDNAENVAEATRDLLTRILVHGSPSRLLVTSRVPLGGSAETKIRVDPLTTPDRIGVVSLAGALACPAVALFVERARKARPEFTLTDENLADAIAICNHLDGLPLAIELAAARVELMSLEQIAARLDDRFRLLQAGPEQDPRHRTLATTLDWSYENLSDDAQHLFNCLGVFASSFDFEAATALAGVDEFDVIDQLGDLVNNSMVATDHRGNTTRYRLIETMRDYAALRLEKSGDTETVGARHFAYFAGLAARLRRDMWSRDALGILDHCRLELPDLRRSFEYALSNDAASALTMVTDLYALWLIRDLAADGGRWMSEAIEALGGIDAAEPSSSLIVALDDAGTLAWMMANTDEAVQFLEAALAMAERLGEPPPPKALVRLGSIRSLAGDPSEGRRLCQLARSIAQDDSSNLESLMVVERTLGAVLALSGDAEEGAAICEQAITRARGTDLWLASALTNLAYATYQINPTRAAEVSLEAIEQAKRIGSKYYQGSAWAGLAAAHLTLGDVAAGSHSYAEALLIMLDSGARQNVLLSLFRLSESLLDVATESAVVLGAGVSALQLGPGSDGTWQELRHTHVRGQVADHLDDQVFDDAWSRGLQLSIDQLVVLARETVDIAWPPLIDVKDGVNS
jgi:predicted ATPase/class 3 adenylate cyclase